MTGFMRATSSRVIIRRWAGVAVVLLLVAGMFALAYFRASAAADTANRAVHSARAAAAKSKEAADRAKATVACVNAALAARDAITGQLHAADVKRVTGQKAAELVKTDGLNQLAHATTPAEGIAGFHRYIDGEQRFTKTLDDYITESNRLRAAQLRHPLGRC